MKFYISSFKIGNSPNTLKDLIPANAKTMYISNGLDFASPEVKKKHQDWDIRELYEIGLTPEQLDLREYFGKTDELKIMMEQADLIYVSGGNVFDLRLAMKLSGFDDILLELLPTNKVYAGYSAAGCVLSPTLRGYHIVDDATLQTYGEYATMWEGLGIVDWMFAPHVDSDHDESEDINKEVDYYLTHSMEYKALRDGDVLIFDVTAACEK